MGFPSLATLNVIVTLVHHISIPKTLKATGGNEKIFAFVLGFDERHGENYEETVKLDELWDIIKTYQENTDSKDASATVGITPKIFMAAIFKLYGFTVARESISNSFASLEKVDNLLLQLEGRMEKTKDASEEQHREWIMQCTLLNKRLMKINKNLTGVQSRVHYIGLSSGSLTRKDSTMELYLRDESLQRSFQLDRKNMRSLECVKYTRRD